MATKEHYGQMAGFATSDLFPCLGSKALNVLLRLGGRLMIEDMQKMLTCSKPSDSRPLPYSDIKLPERHWDTRWL